MAPGGPDAPTPPGVLLGVDVGEARVGLAASDPLGLLAHPVATLARDVIRMVGSSPRS